MANHGVLVPVSIAALNIDSYNRSAVCGVDIDNGNVVVLASKSATAGESEVWTATVPATGALTNLWIAYEPEIVVTVSGSSKYKGLNPDPRAFYTVAGSVFSVFKPSLGDEMILTADALAGSLNTFINATDTTGGIELLWGGSQTGSVLSMKLMATTYISLATGGIDDQRETAYLFQVVGL
jgi:hypothetical protein